MKPIAPIVNRDDTFKFLFGARLISERERLQLTQLKLAALSNVDRVMLGRYERGITEPGASVLMALATTGVDIGYVLTGERTAREVISHEDQSLLMAKGIDTAAGSTGREIHINEQGLATILNMAVDAPAAFVWSAQLLRQWAHAVSPEPQRVLNLQVVEFHPYGTKTYKEIAMYLDRTPPTVWTLGAQLGLQPRYELDVDPGRLPLTIGSSNFPAPVVVIDEVTITALKAGRIVRVEPPASPQQGAQQQ